MTLVLFVLAVSCSTTTRADGERAAFEKLGVTHPQSKNFVRGMAALRASCTQSDSTSIQACQVYTDQTRSLPDMDRFLKAALFDPDTLTGTDRSAFDRITLLGAAYREYIQAKQASGTSDRFWNSLAAGAAVGTLFSAPASQPNCHVYNAHTPSPYVQCQ